MSSLASHGYAVGLLGDLVPDHGVEDEEQLAHGRDEGHLTGLAAPAQAGVEVLGDRVVPDGGHGGHVQDLVYGRATDPGAAPAASLPTVPVQGRDTDQGCQIAAAEVFQIRQFGDEHSGQWARPRPTACRAIT